MRSQLETEKARGEELWEELTDTEQVLAEVRSENSALKKTCAELRSELATQTEPTPQHKLYAEIEELKERNRLLLIKGREERQKLEEKISALEYRDKSQSRRLEEKQARLDELEMLLEGQLSDLEQKSAAASQDLPDAVDLSGKAGELLSFFKTLLPKNTKLHRDTISKIEKILEE